MLLFDYLTRIIDFFACNNLSGMSTYAPILECLNASSKELIAVVHSIILLMLDIFVRVFSDAALAASADFFALTAVVIVAKKPIAVITMLMMLDMSLK